MEHYPSSSTITIAVLLLAAVMVICLGDASTGNAQTAAAGNAQFHHPSPFPQCPNGNDDSPRQAARPRPLPADLGPNWGYYVEQVLAALETTTPNTPAFSYEFGYPDSTTTGNPRGSASCSTNLDVAGCEACLSDAKTKLEQCKAYAYGRMSNGDACTMVFSRIAQ